MRKPGIGLANRVRVSNEPVRFMEDILGKAYERVLPSGLGRLEWPWRELEPSWAGRRGA